jgi:hypothetical protein
LIARVLKEESLACPAWAKQTGNGQPKWTAESDRDEDSCGSCGQLLRQDLNSFD